MLYAIAIVMLVRGEMVTFLFGVVASQSNRNLCMHACMYMISKNHFLHILQRTFFSAPYLYIGFTSNYYQFLNKKVASC